MISAATSSASSETSLEFETLVSNVSARLLGAPVEEIDSTVDVTLDEIRKFFGADRCAWTILSADERSILVVHASYADGVSPLPVDIDWERLYPWERERLLFEQAPVVVSRLSDLPDEAARDRTGWEGMGVRSTLAVPVLLESNVRYLIVMHSVREEREWPDRYVGRLRLLAEMLVNAVERKRTLHALRDWGTHLELPDRGLAPADTVTRTIRVDVADDGAARTRFQEDPRESESRFHDMANTAPAMIWIVGPDKRCTFVNRRWLDFTGRTLEEELGDGWAEGVHPEDLKRCLSIYTGAFDARQEFTMEYRMRRRDGEYGFLLDSGAPRFDPNGEFLGYIGSCVDISEQKKTEQALKESEERFRQVAESAGEFIWEVNAAGLYTYASPSVTKILGYAPEELVQKVHFYDLFAPSVREGLKAAALAAFAERQTFRGFPTPIISKRGVTVHLECSGLPVLDANGDLVGYRGADMDFTERLQSQEVLRQSEQKFRRLCESLRDAYILTDMEGRIQEVNSVCLDLLGYAQDDLRGMICMDLSAASSSSVDIPTLRDQSLLRGYSDAYEMELRKKDGTVFPVELRRFVIRDECSLPIGFCTMVRDITERKCLELETRRSLEEAKQLGDRLHRENIYLRGEFRQRQGEELVVGRNPLMRRALALAAQVAATSSTVLLLGETGTGKERFASLIHEASRRHDRTMIRVNCSAIPSTLIESELFGREKGAYTGATSKQIGRFELAHGSTLFLDEIGDLPLDAQIKLLRTLEERTIERLGNPRPVSVDVRIIAATNRDLERAVREGTFREDLFYRLNVFPVRIPALRERPDDIPLLVNTFVDEFAATMSKRIDGVSPASMAALVAYSWPGNVRELRNVVERAMILAKEPTLSVEVPAPVMQDVTVNADLHSTERAHILRVLQLAGWRVRGQGGAAQRLGLRPTTLEGRMKKLGIQRPTPPGHA